MLEQGHNRVRLAPAEMDRLACWIDLLVPCFGDYREGLRGEDLERYERFLEKRRRWEAQERKHIAAYLEAQAGKR